MQGIPSQMYRDLQSICGLNTHPDNDSASRIQMLGSHLGQKLVFSGMNERRQQTGVEQEVGKYTFTVEMPVDARILKLIDRYNARGIGMHSIKLNPETAVIYEDKRTGEIGVLNLPTYGSYHPYFGFEYKQREGMMQLKKDAHIEKGTVFLDTPGKTRHNNYMYGRELNVAFMSHPAVADDGIVISRDVLKYFTIKKYETRVIEWGKKKIPLNLYGNKDVYKPFPDIGDYVRADGILMALRSINGSLSPVQQSVQDMMNVDFIFDKRVYADGGGGRVIDIKIDTNGDFSAGLSPTDEQLEKYITETRRYYKEILSVVREVQRARGEGMQLTPLLHRLVIDALVATEDEKEGKITKLYRRSELDTFRVEFTIEYEVVPTIGFKLTDCHGG